jgi:hypothetical protein
MPRKRTTRRPPKRGWRQWSEEHARAVLDEFKQSDLTPTAFARAKGITTQRLAWWQRRLADTPAPSQPVAFVAVPVPEVTIEVEHRGVLLRGREGVSNLRFGRVVESDDRRVLLALAGEGSPVTYHELPRRRWATVADHVPPTESVRRPSTYYSPRTPRSARSSARPDLRLGSASAPTT